MNNAIYIIHYINIVHIILYRYVYTPSLLSVSTTAINHSLWLYTVRLGVFITYGPCGNEPFVCFNTSTPLILLVNVIGGPEIKLKFLKKMFQNHKTVCVNKPVKPMNNTNPIAVNRMMNTITNSRLFIEYKRMCTDL